MKKVTFIACAAFLASIAFTGCKNEEIEGNYNGETVKTEFAISLPDQAVRQKMKSTTVQDAGMTDFKGITGIQLVPFAKQAVLDASDTRLSSIIALTEDVAKSEIEGKPSQAKVYSSVSIPLSTGSFLFYGKSAYKADVNTPADKFDRGSLNAHIDYATTASMYFDLDSICVDPTVLCNASNAGGKLLAYLTSVAVANDGATPTPKAWYEYTSSDNAALKAMFDEFTSMHGLSSFEVERVLSDLNKSLKPLVASNALAAGIAAAINNSQYATINASDEVELVSALDNFPGSYNLPDGSVDIKWNTGATRFEEGEYSNMARPNRFVYPAQLWYFANSPIVTSNTSKQTMYDNTNNWQTILDAHTDAVSVNTKTRAVAIVDTIDYAVARFDVQVKLDASTLADNSLSATGIATGVDCSAGFPVSAILVGGQKRVGFDFTPVAAPSALAANAAEYTIYDNVMNDANMKAMPGSSYSALNHTLVLQNGTSDVMVAVEMTNTTGKDFYGVGNQLIPAGGKFYVIAKLIAANAAITGGHVFLQDYKTTARLNLKTLQNAYNTIPDLRTPQLELGFSVNLEWKAGFTYTVDFN